MANLKDFISNPTLTQVGNRDFRFVTDITKDEVRGQGRNLLRNGFDSLGDGSVQAPGFQGLQTANRLIIIAPAHELPYFDKNTKSYTKVTIPESQIVLNTILIDVDQDRNIITTDISGRDGTIKEYISNGDHRISFRGALVNHVSDSLPQAETQLLYKILSAKVTLQVVNEHLNNDFGITDMVITAMNFPQEEGFSNTQFFTFEALSDRPLELTKFKIR